MAKPAKPQQRLRAVPRDTAVPVSAPSPRQHVQWTPALLRQVLRRADGGDMLLLADLCDNIMADERFGELLGQLADDVLGCELTFELSQRSSVGSAKRARELAVDWEYGYDDDELRQLISWTLLTGVGFAKHEAWRETEEGRVVPVLKWWHPQHFAWRQVDGAPFANDQSSRRWHVHDSLTGRWTPIEAGDGTWVIVTRGGEWRPWANGLWRGLSAWWLLKQYAMQDMGIHSEKSAKLIATSSPDSTSEERRAVANYIYEAGKDAVIALPIGFDLKLIETTANVDTIYGAQIRMADDNAAIAILGQNLSTNVQGGSHAAATEHGRKENRRVRNAAWMLSKPLKLQSLSWWAEFNFGDSSLSAYPYWHTEPSEDFAAKAVGLKTLAEALTALKTAGYKLSVDDIEEDYGVELDELEQSADPAVDPRQLPLPGTEDPEESDPSAEEDGSDPDAEASFGRQLVLASGDDPSDAPGFVAGQLYVDELTKREVGFAADSLSGFVDRVAAALDGVDDYESMRYAVIKAYQAEADPEDLARVLGNAALLSHLAGRKSVLDDMPPSDGSASASGPLELVSQERYPTGSSKGGQFKPKTGGSSGSVTVKQGKRTAVGGKSPKARNPAAAPKQPDPPSTRPQASPRSAGRRAKKQRATSKSKPEKPAAVSKSQRHNPVHHEAALKAQYGEAASTVAWGRAMHERGRDMAVSEFHERLSALRVAGVGVVDVRKQQVAKELLQDRRIKTAGQLADAMRNRAELTGSRTLRAYADKVELSAKLAAHTKALDGNTASVTFASGITRIRGTKITRAKAESVRDEAGRFYSAMSHRDIKHPVDVRWVADASPRAYYHPRSNVLNLGAGRAREDHSVVALHELAHGIESGNPTRLAKSVAYLNARSSGERPVTMNELTASTRYKPTEIATPDRLHSPYAGKRYPGDKATEVTAMTVQHMTKIDHSAKVHRTDPDSIDFVLGQLANQ